MIWCRTVVQFFLRNPSALWQVYCWVSPASLTLRLRGFNNFEPFFVFIFFWTVFCLRKFIFCLLFILLLYLYYTYALLTFTFGIIVMQYYCLYHFDYLRNDKSHVHFLFIGITTMTKSNTTTYTILYYIL